MNNKILLRSVKVCETFISLQGEGLHAGFPCFFVRLSGCNLRCRYCDTIHCFSNGQNVKLLDLVDSIQVADIDLVQITGGEPLLQRECIFLMDYLVAKGFKCLLETNGTISLKEVSNRIVKIVDWKTPGSGYPESFLTENLRYLHSHDQIKFVITSRLDFDWATSKVKKYCLNEIATVIFSPAYGFIDKTALANWLVKDRLKVKFQLQLHKELWGDKPGV